jgi:hypothetical protein
LLGFAAEHNGNGGELAWLACHLDAVVLAVDDILDKGEPEAGPPATRIRRSFSLWIKTLYLPLS